MTRIHTEQASVQEFSDSAEISAIRVIRVLFRSNVMTSLQRVLTALSHQEPDRVPFFLLVTMHGAKELDLSIPEYFSKPEYVVEGQLRLRAKYRHDCLYNIYYAPIEVQAWGGEVIFHDDGPANSGEPFIRNSEMIASLQPPRVKDVACLRNVLETTAQLKARTGDDAPIIGVVMSPFSLPVMQMGFDHYLDLIYEQPAVFERLMQINEEFCVEWANAQIEAGATAIGYFDPVSSSTIISRDLYLNTGFQVAQRTLARIKGPIAIHFASGRCAPILAEIAQTGAVLVGTSVLEDLAELKTQAWGKFALLGNLNGIEMRHWTPEQAEQAVKKAIAKAGTGGGYILADNHGEIPWQVSEEVLLAISAAVHKWGQYPLTWIKN